MREICSLKDRATGITYTVAATFGDLDEPVAVALLSGPHKVREFPFDETCTNGDALERAANYKVLHAVYSDPVKGPDDFPPILLIIEGVNDA